MTTTSSDKISPKDGQLSNDACEAIAKRVHATLTVDSIEEAFELDWELVRAWYAAGQQAGSISAPASQLAINVLRVLHLASIGGTRAPNDMGEYNRLVAAIRAELEPLQGKTTMKTIEPSAILYEHTDGRRAVVSAARLATFAIDNPDWHRAGPVEIVMVDGAADSIVEAQNAKATLRVLIDAHRQAPPHTDAAQMPVLPDWLLNAIGEYGMARTDRFGEPEILHRWQELIRGIKRYAAACVSAANLQQSNEARK